MQFRYRARDKQGQLQTGAVEAGDERSAADTLLKRGLTPVALERGAATSAALPGWDALKAKVADGLQPKVSLDELIIFCRQMYSLTQAGIPMLRAIEGLGDTTQNKRLRKALKDIHEQLERGRNLSAAMAKHKGIFPRLIIAIVHVGENTGQLEESFQQLAVYLENEQDTRKRIKAATRYPSFVMIALVVAMFVLNIFVIPTFASMFERFNVELPWATRALLGSSQFFVAYWPLLLALMVGAFFGIRYYKETPPGRLMWDTLKLKVPVIGSILRRAMLGRFARSFSVRYDDVEVVITAVVVSCFVN